MSYEEIIKLILNKGEVQIGDKERNLNFSNLKNDIANLIVEKTYNYTTGKPFPQQLILQVLNDIHFDVKEEQSSKKQAVQAVKIIQDRKIIPIERKLMQIQITIKQENISEEDFKNLNVAINKFFDESKAEILSKEIDSVKTFKIVFNILPNYFRDLVTTYEESRIIC